MSRMTLSTADAPPAIGPYSQAVRVGDLVFVSGQIPLDAATGSLLHVGDITAQTHQVMKQLRAILHAAGLGLEHVAKATIFLTDMADFPRVNEVYAAYFSDEPPARATVEVSRLPKDAAVEIEVIAYAPA